MHVKGKSGVIQPEVLLLCTDAFGGRGGIAKYNRDLSRAVAAAPLRGRLTVVPRLSPFDSTFKVPKRVKYLEKSAGSKIRYSWNAVRVVLKRINSPYDLVISGHINLLPISVAAARVHDTSLTLIIHGIEAWEPHSSRAVRWALREVDTFVAVSNYTKERFLNWAPLPNESGHVLPNCVDLEMYKPGPRSDTLLERYNLRNRTILLTIGRLSAAEQYKGHDEVLEVLSDLAEEHFDLSYLICGGGDDRPRLEAKAEDLGVRERVVFAGYIPEEEKVDHYRLADAFVMPGRGEGFGITYLEAMACGVPVVASTADASQETVRDGDLGHVVDPDDPADIRRGILAALEESPGRPEALDYYSCDKLQSRWQRFVESVCS